MATLQGIISEIMGEEKELLERIIGNFKSILCSSQLVLCKLWNLKGKLIFAFC